MTVLEEIELRRLPLKKEWREKAKEKDALKAKAKEDGNDGKTL